MSLTLTAEDIEAIAERTASKIAAQSGIKPELANRKQAMVMLACESNSSFSRALRELKIKPVMHGKYRRYDIINAIARRSYEPREKNTPKNYL